MPALNKKINNFTDSVIRRMTRIANQHDAINLSQGFPDFDPPVELKNALQEVAGGSIHQYAVTWGAPNFREALAAKQSKFMGIEIDPEQEIVVTCGSTEAMMVAMLTVCNPGDKVVVFSPFYENYTADAILSGAEAIYVQLQPPEFNFDPAELEAALKQGAKALILCNPSNPTGKVFSRAELQVIAELAAQYDIFVITDEVYEHLVYPPYQHNYFAALPGMFERTISCSSLSKTYSITGWRLGYLIAPANIIAAARQVHDFLTVGAAAPLQEAAVTALNFKDDYYQQLQQLYLKKRDFFLAGLDKLGLKYTVPQGAYYVMVDISDFGFANDLDFCEWLIKEISVAAVPGSSFFKADINHLIRFHFAKKEATLAAALARLAKLQEKLSLRNKK
jgi:aminotransferase